MADDCSVMLME